MISVKDTYFSSKITQKNEVHVHPITQMHKSHRSIRKFTDQIIDNATIREIIRCGLILSLEPEI